MRRIDAPAPGGQPLAQGPLAEASAPDRHAMILNAVRCFAGLHRLDVVALPLGFLEKRGKGNTFIDRAIDWDNNELMHTLPAGFGGSRRSYYDSVRWDLERVRDHLLREQPRNRTPELAHGDTNLSNVMYRGTTVAALLDWELCHLGLGEADLAYNLAGTAHFLLGLDAPPGVPDEREIIAAYVEARGSLRDWDYCKLWGEWRLAVYQVMAFSRFPSSMQHIEEMYWANTKRRLSALLPFKS
jgi:aminoglycoside phosphotransferase (APT) family kinase protein